MKTQTFSAVIDAPRERVWKTLWDEKTYPEWTAVFCEGSVAKTDWQEGSKVMFLDAGGSGMVSVIDKKVPGSFISFHHLGEVKNGVENPDSDASKACSGGYENYTLEDLDGKTRLSVRLDLPVDMGGYFEKTWPVALDSLKRLAEARQLV